MSTDDAQLAADIARQAGALLLEIRAQGADDVGRAGDLRSNEFLLGKLAELRPTDAVLSEESTDDHTRLKVNRVWIIDPLDGTREFAMPDRPDWAVHVALYEAGQGITAAAVALPALNEVWSTADPHPSHGGSAAGETAAVGTGQALVAEGHTQATAENRRGKAVVVSDSRPPAFAQAVADAIGARLQPMGSAGAKTMAVLRGDADAYVHAGGQWEWDSA
ncbi:MAG TPA: inositol monophosphatase family protein, partial [Pseudonocardiaceae bacterium]|nr:inositol monophosphatase family protein [Pseudonocardiaceae bacterium]